MASRIRLLLVGRSDRAASAVEYALMVSGIALVIITAVFFFGGTVSDSFNEVGSSVSAVN